MVVAALVAPVVPELSVLVALIIVLISAWKLGGAWLIGRSARRSPGESVSVRRVRFEHRMRSRGYLETDRNGRREWWPVYFHTGLLAIAPDAAATMTTPRVGRTAFLVEPGVVAVSAGRVTRKQPPGTPFDAPRLNDADVRVRAARFGSLRRRVVMDSPAAVAGPVIGVLWVLASGGGIGDFLAASLLAAATAVWASAITGSDPS